MDRTYWYRAFGLTIQSQLPLPATPLAQAPAHADVVVRFGQLGLGVPLMVTHTHLFRATPTETCCHFQNAGTYSVRNGNEIIIDPHPDADEPAMADWLQNAAMSLLLHQRGLFVLHASAVAINGKAIAFVGEAGWGKSTTAAAFHHKGHSLVTDDLVAIDATGATPRIVPGFAHMKLLPEAAAHFGQDIQSMPLVGGDAEKRLRRLSGGFQDSALPLAAICILGYAESCQLNRVSPQPALLHLLRHAFVARYTQFLQMTHTDRTHFQTCTRVIGNVGVFNLLRPRDLAQLPRLVELVETNLQTALAA